jgi:hypothetical protein
MRNNGCIKNQPSAARAVCLGRSGQHDSAEPSTIRADRTANSRRSKIGKMIEDEIRKRKATHRSMF